GEGRARRGGERRVEIGRGVEHLPAVGLAVVGVAGVELQPVGARAAAAQVAPQTLGELAQRRAQGVPVVGLHGERRGGVQGVALRGRQEDRKRTRVNSSHQIISYDVFCL